MASKVLVNNEIKTMEYMMKIEEFVRGLEKGDLVIDEIIKYGYAVYGQSKAGKTSASHLLAGSVLTGRKINGSDMIEPTTTRFKDAKIGNTGNSQTQIPNLLKTTVTMKGFSKQSAKQQCVVLDTPGYGDTYGVLRIFANAFYHYRLYSKVQNMKFIVAFEKSHLSGTADKFLDTITQFTSYFKDYAKMKEKIWQSSCFLITKVDDEQEAIENIKARLLFLVDSLITQLTAEQDQFWRDFVKYIVQEDRIFMIKSVKPGQIIECRGLLDKIEQKVKTWWSRKVVQDVVDMREVAFSLGKQINISIAKSKSSKQQFRQLIAYYNDRIKEVLDTYNSGKQLSDDDNSLEATINQLVNDSMGLPESHSFLKRMKGYVTKYYSKYDINVSDLREKKQEKLFSLAQQNSNLQMSIQKRSSSDKNYVIKKFSAISQIEKERMRVNEMGMKNKRELKILRTLQQSLYKIIKQFNKVSFKKKYRGQIIYKYGYLIHRIIEESKVFFLLLEIDIQPELKKTLSSHCNDRLFVIDRLFIDFMGANISWDAGSDINNYKKLHQQYVESFDLNNQNIKKININQHFLDFFTKDIQINENIAKKINSLILSYSDRVIMQNSQKCQISLQQRKKLMEKLLITRINSEQLINSMNQNVAENSPQKILQEIINLRRITQNLAKLLSISQKFQLAIEVYKSIKFVEQVCKIYQIQIARNPLNLQLRFEFTDYMSDHFREQDAIKFLQKTFQFVRRPQDLEEVRNQLVEKRTKLRNFDPNLHSQYEQQIFQGNYFELFENQKIEQNLNKYFENDSPSIQVSSIAASQPLSQAS